MRINEIVCVLYSFFKVRKKGARERKLKNERQSGKHGPKNRKAPNLPHSSHLSLVRYRNFREYNLMIFADDRMGKTLARFGLKFSKEEPESFSDNYPQVIGIECDVRLKGDQYQKLVDEIRTSKTSERAIVEPIIVKMTELAKEIKSSIDELSKAKSTQLKEPRDLTKEIESLLTANELTFSQLLAALKTTAPTLSSHLDRMVAENRIERTEVGRNVVYRRKVSE